MEEEILEQLPSVEPRNGTVFSPFGTPVTAEEVAKRLSDNLYRQLSDGDDGFVLDHTSLLIRDRKCSAPARTPA